MTHIQPSHRAVLESSPVLPVTPETVVGAVTYATVRVGQLAIQGPEAEEIVGSVLGLECKDLAFYTFKTLDNNEVPAILSRTGYTGEDGFELYGNHDFIIECWDKLIAAGVQPCGLGCRDTLRFEVGLPLYGDELSPEISPVMSGLSMFVKLDKEEFIGKEACAKQKAEGVEKKVIGIELASRAIPRHGYEVEKDGKVVGKITTGYRSISTGKSICMALVDISAAKLGTELQVKIHNRLHNGTVVKKRFYQKSYKK